MHRIVICETNRKESYVKQLPDCLDAAHVMVRPFIEYMYSKKARRFTETDALSILQKALSDLIMVDYGKPDKDVSRIASQLVKVEKQIQEKDAKKLAKHMLKHYHAAMLQTFQGSVLPSDDWFRFLLQVEEYFDLRRPRPTGIRISQPSSSLYAIAVHVLWARTEGINVNFYAGSDDTYRRFRDDHSLGKKLVPKVKILLAQIKAKYSEPLGTIVIEHLHIETAEEFLAKLRSTAQTTVTASAPIAGAPVIVNQPASSTALVATTLAASAAAASAYVSPYAAAAAVPVGTRYTVAMEHKESGRFQEYMEDLSIAATEGDADAQYQLGMEHYYGTCVPFIPLSPDLGKMYLQYAAAQKHPEAINELQRIARNEAAKKTAAAAAASAASPASPPALARRW